ncbi:hypothetical protein P4S95_10390 [Aneurinibacillus aneurinilyticus]|uniref:hypothetical protein n=1 Tax=Aneurinibacillus aneurinilyticus TaxID=1391 RepID=UPI002E1A26BF|nr:hypothetical protein [Aneurinibacillus aneurinilyticus]
MWFIGFLSLLLIPIFVLFAIVALIRKKAAKKYFIAAGFSVLVFGFAIIQSSKDKNTTSPATVTQTQQEKAKSIEEANKLETENKSNSANIGMTPERFQKKIQRISSFSRTKFSY